MKIGDRVKLKLPWDESAKGKIIQARVIYTIELDKAGPHGRKTYFVNESEVEPE